MLHDGYRWLVAFLRGEDGSIFRPQTMKFRTLPRRQRDPRYTEHDAVALRAALEGMVLLKNEDRVLPLPPASVLNVFGAAQDCGRCRPE